MIANLRCQVESIISHYLCPFCMCLQSETSVYPSLLTPVVTSCRENCILHFGLFIECKDILFTFYINNSFVRKRNTKLASGRYLAGYIHAIKEVCASGCIKLDMYSNAFCSLVKVFVHTIDMTGDFYAWLIGE